MWQMVVILLVVAVALVYVIRRTMRIFRSDVPTCSECTECSGARSRTVAESCASCPERLEEAGARQPCRPRE